MWQAQIFTLYPDIFPGPLSKGLYGKALTNNLWNLKVVNIRDAAEDKHKTVDDTPFGGGSGMLLKADVLAKSKGSSNPHNLVKATLDALMKMRDPITIAQQRGIKLSRVFNG